jgi:hypothetical protein
MAEEASRSQVRSGVARACLETDTHYNCLLIHKKIKARLQEGIIVHSLCSEWSSWTPLFCFSPGIPWQVPESVVVPVSVCFHHFPQRLYFFWKNSYASVIALVFLSAIS